MAKRGKNKKGSSEVNQAVKIETLEVGVITDWKPFLLRVLVIIAAGLWAFWPAVHGDWIWDDDLLVAKNALVHDPAGLWKIWFEPNRLVDFFPLKVSVEWLEWQLWQNNTFGYHLTNIILHIFNALLIWRLFSKLGLHLAWLGGLIFVVHPVTVESVAWISELKNTLSLPPLLLAMCAFIDYEDHGGWRNYFLALGLFLVAMLCKTTVVMFPVVILLYIWWKRGQIGMRDLKFNIPFFVISLGLGLITVWFLHQHANGLRGAVLGGFFSRLALAGLSIVFYFSKCLMPVGLMPVYPKWVIDPPSLIQFLPWVVLVGVFYWLWTKREEWGRHAFLGLGFFLINLAPFVGFVAGSYMGFSWVMDHLLYLPIIGLIGLAVAGLGQIEEKLSGSVKPFAIGIVAAVVMLMAWETHGYSAVFVNSEKFWTYAAQRNPEALGPHLNLGMAYVDENRLEEAIDQFQEVLKMEPNHTAARTNLGLALSRKGALSEAIEEYEKVLQLDPDSADAHCNLGGAFLQANRFPEAIEQYEMALKLDPHDVTAYVSLGLALDQEGRASEAIEQDEQALKISPNDALTYNNLGNALGHAGRVSEAIEQYQIALKSDPDNAQTHANLGIALLHMGRRPEAIKHLERAIKNKPDYAEAHNNLGFALVQEGRTSEAVEQFEEAIKNNPDYVQAHDNLGGVLFQTHRVAEAIEQYEMVLKINPNDVNARNQLTRLQGLQSAPSPAAPTGK